MILAIGDIHGCDTALKTMLDLVQPSKDDLVITLGDYVDRGPDSKAVIQTLLDFKSSHQLVHLMGNHEIQMIRALEARHHMERFLDPLCGGQETLDNYGGSFEQIPDDHWEFITSGKLFYETESHIFVHAGLEPDIDLDKQDSETYYYKRFHGVKPHKSGKPYICGHTRLKFKRVSSAASSTSYRVFGMEYSYLQFLLLQLLTSSIRPRKTIILQNEYANKPKTIQPHQIRPELWGILSRWAVKNNSREIDSHKPNPPMYINPQMLMLVANV